MSRALRTGDPHNLMSRRSQGDDHPMYLMKRGANTFLRSVTFGMPQDFKKGIDINTVGDNLKFGANDLNRFSWQGNDDTNYAMDMGSGSGGAAFDGRLQYNGTSGAYRMFFDGPILMSAETVDFGDSPFTHGITDLAVQMVDTLGGPVTFNLPAAPRFGQIVIVKDHWNNADVNAITVQGNGNFVEGGFSTSYTMNSALEAVWFQFDGAEDWWSIG